MASSKISSPKSVVTVAVIMFVSVLAAAAATAVAEETTAPQSAYNNGPGLLPYAGPGRGQQYRDYVRKCWREISTIPECPHQIIHYLVGKKSPYISSKCCVTVDLHPEDCWKKMFPFHPEFPAMLKNYCSAAYSPASPSSTI